MESHANTLRMIAWELTRACNLACLHCRAAAIDKPTPDELSTEECFALIDQIASFATPSISIDGKDAQSHDALRAVPGAFDGALRGIEAAKAADLPFQLNTTVTRENADQLAEIHRLAISLRAAAHHVFLLVPTGRAADYRGLELDAERYEAVLEWLADRYVASGIEIRATCAPHFYRILRQRKVQTRARGCLAGQAFCFISHTGEVQPCGYFDQTCGNVRRKPLAEIWATAPLFLRLRDHSAYRGKCGALRLHPPLPPVGGASRPASRQWCTAETAENAERISCSLGPQRRDVCGRASRPAIPHL